MKKELLYEIAKIIDNDFIGSEETFTCDFIDGYYYLNTNKCDWCSIVRVYFDGNKITKITRLCDDTDGWQEIHENTMARVKNIIKLKTP